MNHFAILRARQKYGEAGNARLIPSSPSNLIFNPLPESRTHDKKGFNHELRPNRHRRRSYSEPYGASRASQEVPNAVRSRSYGFARTAQTGPGNEYERVRESERGEASNS